MIGASEQTTRTITPAFAGLKSTTKVFLLRLGPFVAALMLEPWAAAATSLTLLSDQFRVLLPRTQPRVLFQEELSQPQSNVLGAATSLLGVSAAIIVALTLTNENAKTWSDEAAWISAAFMLASIVLSRAVERGRQQTWRTSTMSWCYIAGTAALLVSLMLALWLL
jgi:uncharacterized membrane protein YecN with MAPEG domain